MEIFQEKYLSYWDMIVQFQEVEKICSIFYNFWSYVFYLDDWGKVKIKLPLILNSHRAEVFLYESYCKWEMKNPMNSLALASHLSYQKSFNCLAIFFLTSKPWYPFSNTALLWVLYQYLLIKKFFGSELFVFTAHKVAPGTSTMRTGEMLFDGIREGRSSQW